MKKLPFPIDGYRPGVYDRCRWCGGRGCPGCDEEAMKDAERLQAEYERQFPNGPMGVSIPIDRLDDAKSAIGRDAIIAAFSQGGKGAEEVFDNLERLGFGRPKPLSE